MSNADFLDINRAALIVKLKKTFIDWLFNKRAIIAGAP